MPQIWLTSDLHLGHDREFLWSPRGCKSLNEMEEKLMTNWNSCVREDDIVYILGDIAFGQEIDASLALLKQFNGKKYLAIGNHDTDNKILKYREFNLFEDIQFAYRLKYKKISLMLTHYPTIVANNGDPKPVWNIHGHTHSDSLFNEFTNCYNVAPEAHDCAPVALDTAIQDIRAHKRDCAKC